MNTQGKPRCPDRVPTTALERDRSIPPVDLAPDAVPACGPVDIDWMQLRRAAWHTANALLQDRNAAEDIAQEAVLALIKKGTAHVAPAKINGYVRRCARHAAIDRLRGESRRIVLPLDSGGSESTGSASDDLAVDIHQQVNVPDAGVLGIRYKHAINPEHVLLLLRAVFCALTKSPRAAGALFTKMVLLGNLSSSQRADAVRLLAQVLSVPRGGKQALMSLSGQRLITLPWLASLPHDAASDYIDDLYGAMQYTLADVGILRHDGALLTIAIQSAATLVHHLQSVLKDARLDIFMRSKPDRHALYDSRLSDFTSCVDSLYIAARIPRSYLVAGILAYLHETAGLQFDVRLLLDPGYAESFLHGWALSHEKTHYLDRWISIIALGMFYELHPRDAHNRERLLSEIEHNVRLSPVERAGTAFAWLSAAGNSRDSVIEDKVLRLVNMECASELAMLPITLYAPFVGDTAKSSMNERQRGVMWEATQRGLIDRSPIAKIGALRHLFYLAQPAILHTPDDIHTAVLALQGAENPYLSRLARQVKFRHPNAAP